MIQLLERIRGLEIEAGSAPTTLVGERSGRLLEWPQIKQQIASRCINLRAAHAVLAREPFGNPERIELEHTLADEMRPAAARNIWPPLIELTPLLELLEQPPPLRLEGPDLVLTAAAGEELDSLRNYFLAERRSAPSWGEAAVQMSTFTGLSNAVRRALDNDGRLRDDASPLLGRLRRLLGEQERTVRSETQRALGEARSAGWVTGDEVTLRGDRYCLPLRAGDVRRVDGIIHDRSASGATLFVEPAGVVQLSNRLTETRLEIAAEEARILFELNRAVEEAAGALAEAAGVMLLVDGARAHLLWSRDLRCHRPALDDGGRIRICGGRHPLLLEALGGGDFVRGREAVVPLDLELDPESRVLVISGPNAGGKSVALKSVGVFCLIAQCGWDVPAREDTILPRLRRLLVDLGDDQSIAQSLSSFSAHLSHLGRFLEAANEGTLILCDEIGSGTDPQEGTALAYCVLEQLARRGARVLASTHFGLLKAAVHDHPQMVNAAMDYDDRDLQPLFTVRVGDPGTSHAFDIAARLGFEPGLLARAREMVGQERVQIEQLLVDLDRRARELTDAQEALQSSLSRQSQQEADLKQRLRGWKKERRDLEDRYRHQADELLRESRRRIEQAVKEVRTSDGEQDVIRTARDRMERTARKLLDRLPGSADLTDEAPARQVREGDRVRIPHLGLIGRVVEVRGDKLVATSQGMRLSVTRDAVRALDETGSPDSDSPSDTTPTDRAGGWNWHGPTPDCDHLLDLRGETGQDGWERLDRLIDRAIPAGLEVLHVIHGHGTGRLRDHLHRRLKSDRRVIRFEEAGAGQGGGGTTLVFLAAD